VPRAIGWAYLGLSIGGTIAIGGIGGASSSDKGPPGDGGVLEGLSDARSAAVIVDSTYRDDMHSFAKFQQLLTSNSRSATANFGFEGAPGAALSADAAA
jgi:hypothetical protein